MGTSNLERVRALADEHVAVAEATRAQLLPAIAELGERICSSLASGGTLITFGNGGSAADAQHFAAELTGHFATDRGPLRGIALTTDTSALTAIANDYDYGEVYARQVRALARAGDVVVGLSTSGNAENVFRGLQAANEVGAHTVALTGGTGGRVRDIAAQSIVVPSAATARIQEMHIMAIHIVCALIDDWAEAR